MASQQPASGLSDSDDHYEENEHNDLIVMGEYHERKLCGPHCCGSPVQLDVADSRQECLRYHKLWLCGWECCGKSPGRSVARARRLEERELLKASELRALREAAAATSPTVNDTHEVQLVVSYMRHFAEYCASSRGHMTELFPLAVWKKVRSFVDFGSLRPCEDRCIR